MTIRKKPFLEPQKLIAYALQELASNLEDPIVENILQYCGIDYEKIIPEAMDLIREAIRDAVRQILQNGIPVKVAAIEHEYGVNFYAAFDQAQLNHELYDFVSEWWEDTFEDEPLPDDHEEAIHAYFEETEDESVTTDDQVWIVLT